MKEHMKHRLAGVIMLIALLILFIPAVLKHSNQHFDDAMNVALHLPKKPALPRLSLVNKDNLFEDVKVAKANVPAVKQVAVHTRKADVLKGKAPVAYVESTPSLISKSKSVFSQLTAHSAYAIQLATFTKPSNAQTLVDSLRSKGFEASMQIKQTTDGALYHVVVGRVAQRDAAVDLQKKLVDNTQLNGIIVKTKVS